MRSTEASGAGAHGFRASNAKGKGRLRRVVVHSSRVPLLGRITPITLSVAATAFFAAALFVVYDSAVTLGKDTGSTTQLPSNVIAASFAGEPASLSLHDEKLPEVAGRGSIAFALAGLATILSARRRRHPDMPDASERANYSQLAAAIPLGLACWTRSGQLIVCNEQYRDRLDIEDADLTYHQAVSRLIAGGYMKVVGEDRTSRLLELHREDGSCLRIDERPLGDGAFMTLVTDVTERKRTDALLTAIREDQRQLARRYHEEKLKAEAASRAKTNFLAHLSHDIRTPLNHIIGFAELMKHETYGPLGDKRYAEYVQTIKASGEHLLTSFAAILDLTELESGQKPLRHDPVLLDEILDTVVRRFQGQMQRSGITLTLGQSTGAVLRGDRLGLTRMLGNIVDNAVRFTRPGGTVTLASFAAEDGVVIEVSDTGVGMDEERLASLSQPFAFGDATFTREGIGPGLGISIARAIAELSGGHIAIDSSPSLGTTVAISLPIDPAAASLVAAA